MAFRVISVRCLDRSLLTSIPALRDTCEQGSGPESYGWKSYEPRSGGIQEIHDVDLGLELVTQFVKSPVGESWKLRVNGSTSSPSRKTAVVFHIAMEDAQSSDAGGFQPNRSLSCNANDSSASFGACRGHHPSLGNFELESILGGRENLDTHIVSYWVSEDEIWQAGGKSTLRRHYYQA